MGLIKQFFLELLKEFLILRFLENHFLGFLQKFLVGLHQEFIHENKILELFQNSSRNSGTLGRIPGRNPEEISEGIPVGISKRILGEISELLKKSR